MKTGGSIRYLNDPCSGDSELSQKTGGDLQLASLIQCGVLPISLVGRERQVVSQLSGRTLELA